MRFTITPLGSDGTRTVAAVVDDIVRYLDSPDPLQAAAAGRPATLPAPANPARYYGDGSSEPGRWLGNGAAEMELAGPVATADFARVLAGRDPHTGARLITARGSAGRKATLARGQQTRCDADGEPLYDLRDAAAALNLEPADIEALVEAGQALAVRHIVAVLGGGTPSAPADGGAYLATTIDAGGARWITEAELQRFEAARAAGPDPKAVAAAGEPDDLLSLMEAARVTGVSARYLRTLCSKWQDNRERIEAARAAGEEPPRPFLRAYKGTKRQWLVKRSDLVDYLQHRSPPAVRVGFDLTLTTEKSLGVLALLGGDHARAEVLGAIQAGNDRGLAHLEYAAAMARLHGQPVSTRGWTVASFRHLTSRALDPFPHHHNVVANTVVDPGGDRRALDARWLYLHAGEASALATAEMRHQLTTRLGVRWRRGRKGGWEIDGIPDAIVREFSQRSNEVDEAVAELEALIGRTATITELRGLVTRTRPAKRRAEVGELVEGWWQRAEAHGFTPRHLERCTGRATAVPLSPDPEEVFARLADPDGLCASGSIFTRVQVVAAIVDMGVRVSGGRLQPLLLPAGEVEHLADAFLASDHVIELLPAPEDAIAGLGDQPLFTTAEMLAVQARILERFREGRSMGAATVPAAVVETALAEHGHLTAEQHHFVTSLCTSGDRVQCAIGRAGAGKTTAVRAAAAAWAAAGYRVLGTAVKGEAARHLGQEAAIPSETLAWHLAHTDPARGPLDARTILVVDEASTVSDRELDRLLWLAAEAGAAVRLVGDPAQHGSVGAGGMFGVLCRAGADHTPELRTSHRVEDAADRDAADALRDGRIADALAALDAAGHLHVVADEVEVFLDLLDRWWRSRQAGHEHPMVDRRNHTRWQLNRLAHRLLQVTGEVGAEEVVAAHDRRFSVGDRVVARKGDRSLHPPDRPRDYVRNGATGTVVAIRQYRNHTRDAVRVAFDGIGEVELPRAFFDEHRHPGGRTDVGLDHAYAVTSYAVQGATFAESTSRIDDKASRSETYVDITRGRSANHLYLTRGADPLDGERLPKAPPPPIAASVTARLSGSGPERAALDVDPGAPAADVARAGGNLAELHERAVANTEDTPAVAASELRARQAARVGCRRLDSSVLSRLPPRSYVPFLARQWDQTAAELSVFLARWGVTPGGNGRWEWALGPRSDRPAHDRDRRQTAALVVDLTVATASERMRQDGEELPPWARPHLAHHAARGVCVHEPSDLRTLYQRIETYRRDAAVTEAERPANAEEAIFGPAPDDPVLRARRRALIDEALPREVAERAALARAAG
jgi:conjugative relaxase-like TrwC/TraI family protein